MKRWMRKLRFVGIRPQEAIRESNSGFTLLEVIAVIVLSAVFGTMLVQFMGTSITQSAIPLSRTRDHYSLTAVTDKITAVYRKLMVQYSKSSDALGAFKNLIDDGSLLDGNKYTWQTKYIAFDATDTEKSASEGNKVLKVTLTNKRDNQTIVTLFTG
jgi:prepilin-type N-terminal cleavage/methylation domain-containing protein